MTVYVRAYTSPTLVLLAYDWGDVPDDFLGFAIERTPGADGNASMWLPNRIGFDGPPEDGSSLPSNVAPIQKYYWWDARIDTRDRGSSFTYRVVPVRGTPHAPQLVNAEAATIIVKVPLVEEHGITTHFNRAVVSSQGFSAAFPHLDTPSQQKAARAWLANGMEQAVPEFLARAAGKDIEGAIYHLTDDIWVVPALRHYGGSVSLAYHHKSGDTASDVAIQQLIDAGRPESAFAARTRANIMHDKFLVRVGQGDHPEAVLTGSANFTSEALSVQANVLHAFESPPLAKLYVERKRLLDGDPTLAKTAAHQQGWSHPIDMEDARLRVFFPPEPGSERGSLDAIVDAVKNARSSVLLCAFDPTDADLLKSVFSTFDKGKMMLALVNRVPSRPPTGDPERADVAAKISILDHHARDHDVMGFDAFSASDTPPASRPSVRFGPARIRRSWCACITNSS